MRDPGDTAPVESVQVETRELGGSSRQISSRRFGSSAMPKREADLEAAIVTVARAVTQSVEKARAAGGAAVERWEISFNVALIEGEGSYICANSEDATFQVKLTMTGTGGPHGQPGPPASTRPKTR